MMDKITLVTVLSGSKLYIIESGLPTLIEYDRQLHKVLINGEWQQLPDFIECRFSGEELVPFGTRTVLDLDSALGDN